MELHLAVFDWVRGGGNVVRCEPEDEETGKGGETEARCEESDGEEQEPKDDVEAPRTTLDGRPLALVEDGALECGDVDGAAALLKSAGVAVLTGACDRVRELKEAVDPVVLRTIEGLDARRDAPRLRDPDTFAFAEACGRGVGRVDVKVDGFVDEKLLEACERQCLDAARVALGEGAVKIMARGVVVSFEGAPAQRWHRDGDQLFGEACLDQLPAYAVTIFLPLVDVDPDLGPTQFLPGSHVARRDDPRFAEPITRPPAEPLPRAGDAVLFDYRIVHRGGSHARSASRPVYYAVAARSWFVDDYNFPNAPSIFDDQAQRVTCDDDDDGRSDRSTVCCLSSGRVYAGDRLAACLPLEAVATVDDVIDRAVDAVPDSKLVYRDLKGSSAARALAAEARFVFVDSLCFLRDRDLRDRHLLQVPPLPTARDLGLEARLRARDTAALRVDKVDDNVGLGVFANEAIPARTLIAEYAGLVAPASSSPDAYALDYALSLANEPISLSAKHYGNVARFVNHDSHRNNADLDRCTFDGLVRVVVVSNRPIQPGEQILVDYGTAYWANLKRRPVRLDPEPARQHPDNNKVRRRFSIRALRNTLLRLVDDDYDQCPDAERAANAAWRDFETW